MLNNKWIPYFLAAVIFGAGVGFGTLSNRQFPTEPTLIATETDWHAKAFEVWAFVSILPEALAEDRLQCETVRSIRQCAWMMEKMEFGIRAIMKERMPKELQDALLYHQRSPL